MRKNRIPDYVSAVLPALLWLLFRYAGKSLPPAAAVCAEWILPAAAVFWYCRKNRFSAFRLPVREFVLWTGIGIACGILNRICFGKPAELIPSVSSFLLMCILSPAAEEMIYRGIVYERCLEFLPSAGALLLNSLLFAAAHGTAAGMAAALAAGILFSAARKKTGSVTAPVLLHVMSNTVVFLF